MLRARESLQKEWDDEQDRIGRQGFEGKRFLDVGALREAVRLKGRGMADGEIESRLALKKGSLGRIRSDVVSVVR